jgi:lipopolysaccharide assembly protein A
MRAIYAILLLIFVAAVVVFALQNMEPVTIKYLDRSESFALSAVIGAVYVLGMLTGWTIVGIVKRSFQRVTERRG